MNEITQILIAGTILTAMAAGVIVSTIDDGGYEYTFDPKLKIWTNANGATLDMKKATCNYSLISETARSVKFGEYKENVYMNPNQTIMISVIGGKSETLSAYLVTVDLKNEVKLNIVK